MAIVLRCYAFHASQVAPLVIICCFFILKGESKSGHGEASAGVRLSVS